jgi:xanthine dehydrogenase molybdenum-binding subunit
MSEEVTINPEWPWLWEVPEGGAIGKRGLGRVDGLEKASGRAIYTRDIVRPGMLYAKALRSPYAHAKITLMDTSKAAAMAGVKAILTYEDSEIQAIPKYKTIFDALPDTAYFYQQPVGVIVCAESEYICDRALEAIDITWEQLDVILDPEEALAEGAPIMRPDLNADNNIWGSRTKDYGDIEAGFKEAEMTIEFSQSSEEDVWAGVEPNSGVAEWKGDNLEVWYHDQVPRSAQTGLATYTTMDKVNVHSPYHGGFFGGLVWTSYLPSFAHFAPILSKKTGRPVKVLDDGSCFHGCGEKLGKHYYKVGFKMDGTITALQVTCVNTAQTLHDQYIKIRECTRIENMSFEDSWPYYSRGPGVCYKHGDPAASVQNLVFTHVADALDMDPTELAYVNDGTEGIDKEAMDEEKAMYGFNPDTDSLRDVIEIGKQAIDWDNKWHAPGTKILENGKYHGIGFTWIVAWNLQGGTSSTAIKIRDGARVSILSRHADGGWNTETTCCQVVADELGVPFDTVSFRPFDEVGFEAGQGASSSGMIRTIPAMVGAARKLRQYVFERATSPRIFWADTGSAYSTTEALFPGLTPEELDLKDGVVFEKANPDNKYTLSDVISHYSGRAFGGEPVFVAWDNPEPYDTPHPAFARQCYFVEIEVDPETGQVEVIKDVVVNDVGKVINPDSANGQQYGGAYMGLGCTFMEAIYYDESTGVKLNDNLIGYPVALMNDIGTVDCHLVENGLGFAAYGCGGIAESSAATQRTLGGPAIYNAIGKWVDDWPITPDKVLKALGKA